MEFGSVNNGMLARMTNGAPAPEVGMGATMLMWSDRQPATVIAVSKSGKRCTVQMDDYQTEYPSGYAKEESMTRNPNGPTYELSLRKDGQWKEVGGSQVFAIGYRAGYSDPHF